MTGVGEWVVDRRCDGGQRLLDGMKRNWCQMEREGNVLGRRWVVLCVGEEFIIWCKLLYIVKCYVMEKKKCFLRL